MVAIAQQVNIGRIERWLSLAAGGALTAYAWRNRRTTRKAAAFAGTALLYRGASGHSNLYQALGINRASPRGYGVIADRGSDTRWQLAGPRGIHVDESITIKRPAAQLYRFWRDLENLPQLMSDLESVAVRDHGISHWVVKGPGGARIRWDARMINDVDNKIIAWQSLNGSTISTAGAVNFTETDEGTVVRVHLQYQPPAGRLGNAVASVSGAGPRQQVRSALRRFKQLMESGTAQHSLLM